MNLSSLFAVLSLPLVFQPQLKGRIRDILHLQECLEHSLLSEDRNTILSVCSGALEGRTVHYMDPTGGQKSTNVNRLYRPMPVSKHHGLWHIDAMTHLIKSEKASVIA